MKKMRHFYRHFLGFLALSISLTFFSGCTSIPPSFGPEEIPLFPSSAYRPKAPLPLPAAPVTGQPPYLKGQSLNLAQCIEIALERNPETRASWEAIRSAAAGVGQAKSIYLPSADITGGANRSKTVNLERQQDTGSHNTFDAVFGVHYLLFNGGARSADLKKAEAELLNVDFQHNATLQDVALKIEEAYYRLLADKELERVARQTVQQTQYHVDVARARYNNGLVAKSDVLKATTEKANADLLLVRARNEIRIARGRLANAMGLRPSESFKIAGLPDIPPKKELADVNRLMSEAAGSRPELLAAQARIASARAKVDIKKGSYWPEITLTTDYGWRDKTFNLGRNEWFVGVGFSWSLFSGFNRAFSVRRAKSDLARSIAEYKKLLHGVELEIWTAYSQLIEAGQAIKAARAFVDSAEESARVTEGEYKNGATSIIEVTDAQATRTTANVRLVQARLDWYMALARLDRALGRITARAENNIIIGKKVNEKAQKE